MTVEAGEPRAIRIAAAGDDGSNISSEIAIIGDTVYTTQVPERADGSIETGDVRVQSVLTLENLKRTLEAHGSGLEEVAHLTIYLLDVEDRHAFNEVYHEYFSRPYPVRCAVAVQGMTVAGMRVEVTAVAARSR